MIQLFSMTLSEELKQRGFIYQFSGDSLEEVLDADTKRTVYLGIDPTADAIHVGNLVPYIFLKHLMDAGHSVILLMGGATALIGDPSGKDTEREFVDESIVSERVQKMEQNVRQLTKESEVRFVNNHDWLSSLSMIAFLRDVGKHFTVNAMMKKESVARRLESEQGISYTEFSYSLLQGYDFHHLHTEYNCTLQIGGSDQWGNIISGVDYVRRVSGKEVYGLTMPLVVDKATGRKFGKSEGNAIWLDAEKTSPYAFYQFWLNTSDESVVEYLKLFTFLSLEKIGDIESSFRENPGERLAQRTLADAVTTFVHGEEICNSVKKVTQFLFSGGNEELTPMELEMVYNNAPTLELGDAMSVVDLLVQGDLAQSKREARTFVESGAVSFNGVLVPEEVSIDPCVQSLPYGILRRGKKQLCVLKYV